MDADGAARGHEAVLHEVIGPDLAPYPAATVLLMGVLALLITGVGPALLGALLDAHRITAAGIGVTAMLELLTMGLVTGAAGALLKGDSLRTVGAGACLLLAAANVATLHAQGISVYVIRTLAGAPEGLLLWITVGMIARSRAPERWAAIFFTAQVVAQLSLALAFLFIVPRFGADGGYACVAVTCLIGLPFAMALPQAYGPLVQSAGLGGAPPPRGWIALAGTLVLVAAASAVAVYLQPLAHQAGLSAQVARTALWASLAAQVVGGVIAALLSGKVRYIAVFGVAVMVYLIVWFVFGLRPSAWMFVAANAAGGFVGLLVGPFLVPMTIEVDPTRRTAMQSAGAQVLGGAGGPLLAALVVGEKDAHGVLWLAAALLLAGFCTMAWLSFTNRPAISAAADTAP